MLFICCENVGRFSHEMNPTKHDVFCLGLCCHLAKHERIAQKIGVHNNAVALVVVAQDQQIFAKLSFEFFNPVGNGLLFG